LNNLFKFSSKVIKDLRVMIMTIDHNPCMSSVFNGETEMSPINIPILFIKISFQDLITDFIKLVFIMKAFVPIKILYKPNFLNKVPI
jgi:hypothetical protein